jgi:hypothetical protein
MWVAPCRAEPRPAERRHAGGREHAGGAKAARTEHGRQEPAAQPAGARGLAACSPRRALHARGEPPRTRALRSGAAVLIVTSRRRCSTRMASYPAYALVCPVRLLPPRSHAHWRSCATWCWDACLTPGPRLCGKTFSEAPWALSCSCEHTAACASALVGGGRGGCGPCGRIHTTLTAALPHRLSAAHTLAWPSRVFSFSLKHNPEPSPRSLRSHSACGPLLGSCSLALVPNQFSARHQFSTRHRCIHASTHARTHGPGAQRVSCAERIVWLWVSHTCPSPLPLPLAAP